MALSTIRFNDCNAKSSRMLKAVSDNWDLQEKLTTVFWLSPRLHALYLRYCYANYHRGGLLECQHVIY